METTNTIIKFSPGRELYPKTNERVCVIIGSIPNICIALRRIFSKIANSPHRKPDDSQEYLRHFKMLVSNIAAGMTIGKSGQTVKAIQQECSVKIQISNKDDSSLPERTLNIVGESTEEIVAAVKMVLDQVKEDPDANKWKKLLTYGAYLASPAAVGGAHGHASSLSSVSLPTTGFQTSGYGSGMSELSAGAATNSSFLSMLQHPAYAAALSSAMQSNSAVAGLMGGASGHGSTVPTTSGSSFNQALLSYIYAQSLMSGSSYFGQYNPVFVDGVNMSVPGATIASFDVAVPEVMVSSVVGPGAKLLTDLMQSTGARLQLSQKGDYFAGTYNRKLTISGPILSVQAAHMVVLQKLMKDQEAYQKQGLVWGGGIKGIVSFPS